MAVKKSVAKRVEGPAPQLAGKYAEAVKAVETKAATKTETKAAPNTAKSVAKPVEGPAPQLAGKYTEAVKAAQKTVSKPKPTPVSTPKPAPVSTPKPTPTLGRYDAAGNYIGASSPISLPDGRGMTAKMAEAIRNNPSAYPGYADPSTGKDKYTY